MSRRGRRGSALLMTMFFVTALGALVAALLIPLLTEQREVDRGYLRLVAVEMLDSGVEVARAGLPAPGGEPVRRERVFKTPALRADFEVAARAHPRGRLATVTARVESVAGGFVCTQERRVVVDPAATLVATSTEPYTCTIVP